MATTNNSLPRHAAHTTATGLDANGAADASAPAPQPTHIPNISDPTTIPPGLVMTPGLDIMGTSHVQGDGSSAATGK